MKKKLFALFSPAVLLPMVALAQTPTGVTPSRCFTDATIQGMICKLSEILNSLMPFLIILGVVYFVWGVLSFVISDEEEAKSKGRDRMIAGIIGLAVIIGLWGLVRIVTNTFGINNASTITLPTVVY